MSQNKVLKKKLSNYQKDKEKYRTMGEELKREKMDYLNIKVHRYMLRIEGV